MGNRFAYFVRHRSQSALNLAITVLPHQVGQPLDFAA
jgi:hypothetical protein